MIKFSIYFFSMGCGSSLTEYQQQTNVSRTRVSHSLNMNFSDFVKANIGGVYKEYHFAGWIYRNINSIIRWAVHRRSQVMRVVKIITRNLRTEQRVMKEINILKKLDHPSIIRLHEYFLDNEFIYLIFQPADGKHIYNPIVGVQHSILRNLQNIIKQILLGVQHIHSRGIAHCRLTPEHIMIMKGDGELFVKIIGFGDAFNFVDAIKKEEEKKKQLQQDEDIEILTTQLSIKKKISSTFESPQKNSAKNISKQDIWSCGTIMSHVLGKIFGTVDFLSFSEHKLQLIIKQKSENIQQSEKSVSLVKCMLQANPDKRLTASECLKHEYFQKTIKASPWKVTIIFRSLHSFQDSQKLQSFLSMYLTYKDSTIQEQNQFLTEFYNLDKNKDGSLQYEQLLEGLKNYYNISEKDAESYVTQIFKNLDKNKNNSIQYSQFLLGTVNLAKIVERKSIRKLFNEIDRNSDGFIDGSELKQMLGSYGAFMSLNPTKISYKQFEQIIIALDQK